MDNDDKIPLYIRPVYRRPWSDRAIALFILLSWVLVMVCIVHGTEWITK